MLATEGATQSYNQESAASTRGQTDAHYGSCQQQRSQPATQFSAYCLGSGARIYPREADVNLSEALLPSQISFQGVCSNNVDTSSYLNINMQRLQRNI